MRSGSVLGPEDRTGAWGESQKSSQRQDPGIHPCTRIRSHHTPRIPAIIPALGSGNSSRSWDPGIPPAPGIQSHPTTRIQKFLRYPDPGKPSQESSPGSAGASQNPPGPGEHPRTSVVHRSIPDLRRNIPGIPLPQKQLREFRPVREATGIEQVLESAGLFQGILGNSPTPLPSWDAPEPSPPPPPLRSDPKILPPAGRSLRSRGCPVPRL